MTAGRAPGELILAFPLLPTGVGLGMGCRLVVRGWFPILPGGSWVSVVLVSSFFEAVVGVV